MNTSLSAQTSHNVYGLAENDFFEKLRKEEYSRVDEEGHTYLDYTGGNLYPASLVLEHQRLLLTHTFGNPHSTNPTSQMATVLVEEARRRVLEFFNAKDYICVFTQNASGALKIVGESYPFDDKSTFLLLSDNHNSVNGIREFCNAKKGTTKYVPIQFENFEIHEETLKKYFDEAPKSDTNLFAMPAQSNVSGVKHDLGWIAYAHSRGFDVLLDAAAFVPTSTLDLSKVKPDYVSVSFYKIFGYPTGLGCLLIHRDAYAKLHKPWFAGGTVDIVSVVSPNKFLTNGHERFEDGTVNYTGIPAITLGLNFIEGIGMNKISTRIRSLIETLTDRLKQIKHQNGKPVVKIFGAETFDHRGGNIIMNFFDPQEKLRPYFQVEKISNDLMISLRSGCFCNPGIDELNHGITAGQMELYFMSRDTWDGKDMMDFIGKVRGAIRVSVGIATTEKDLNTFLDFVSSLADKEF
jgi:selenocysteine lyase/cysteine desulfurase